MSSLEAWRAVAGCRRFAIGVHARPAAVTFVTSALEPPPDALSIPIHLCSLPVQKVNGNLAAESQAGGRIESMRRRAAGARILSWLDASLLYKARNMKIKNLLIAMSLMLVAGPSMAEVGVSVTVGEPGFFGQIVLGDAPRPLLLAPRPIIIEPLPPRVVYEPLYLYVPVVESSNWARYCRRYRACGRPVYFIQERWYRNVYVPHYRKHRHNYDRRYREHHADYVRHEDHGAREHDGHGGGRGQDNHGGGRGHDNHGGGRGQDNHGGGRGQDNHGGGRGRDNHGDQGGRDHHR
jgi:hypothetical protein